MTIPPLRIIGITAAGAADLGRNARQILHDAPAVHGAPRQLDLVAEVLSPQTARRELPRPLLPALRELVEGARMRGEVILASGDPMFHGIGATITRMCGATSVEVIPAVSSVALAAARLGWPVSDTETINLLTGPASDVLPLAYPRARFFVLCPDARTPGTIATTLVEAGLGAANCHVLADLGAATETHVSTTAAGLSAGDSPITWSDLCLLAVDMGEIRATEFTNLTQSRQPGLHDAAYATEAGQLTKQIPRSVAVSLLRPYPGAMLWDIGGGAGSISIEWLRSTPRTRAVCFESQPPRSRNISANAARLGVSQLTLIGSAPTAFAETDSTPDAVFIGGGVNTPGLLEQAWKRLAPGGRLVATAVTVESEQELHRFHRQHPGHIFRLGVEQLSALGNFSGWDPARNLVFYAGDKQSPYDTARGVQVRAEGGCVQL